MTSSVPIYTMQTAKLPGGICDELDRTNRNFLWGFSLKTSPSKLGKVLKEGVLVSRSLSI